jgi:sec-independent protein translocase protein TatC
MSDLNAESSETLTSHLSELRTRLIRAVLGIMVGTMACYSFSDKIFDAIRRPIAPYLPEGGLIFTGPADLFIAHLKLSVVAGVIVSCPFWLYQIWLFIAPGLYKHERKYASVFILTGSLLFLTGIAFCYFGVLPIAFEFLLNYGGGQDKPFIAIDQYLSFFTQMCLVFGAAFELPLIIVILGMLGIVSQKFLREKRRFAIVILAFFAAILTPPDVLSMGMMLVPLVFLYEVSVIIVGIFEKKRLEQAD